VACEQEDHETAIDGQEKWLRHAEAIRQRALVEHEKIVEQQPRRENARLCEKAARLASSPLRAEEAGGEEHDARCRGPQQHAEVRQRAEERARSMDRRRVPRQKVGR
jgi:hypothetical protein